PSFPEQANIALRHHCMEGNMKWVSLMLWAGADPYAPGISRHNEERDPDYEGLNALGYAVLYRHFEIFQLKQIKLDPAHPRIGYVVQFLGCDEGFELLKRLLEKGLNPNDQENGGCSKIQGLLQGIDDGYAAYNSFGRDRRDKIDTERGRDKIKIIH